MRTAHCQQVPSGHQRRARLPRVGKGPGKPVPEVPVVALDRDPQSRPPAVVVDEPRVTRTHLDHVRVPRLPPDGEIDLPVDKAAHQTLRLSARLFGRLTTNTGQPADRPALKIARVEPKAM